MLADGRIVPPAIMWMFMTGDINQAVAKGMLDQGMTGAYTYVNANAEMLISHGVEPKTMAPKCAECHGALTGHNNLMVPFTQLGYHTMPALVKSCTLCHEKETLSWERIHDKHRSEFACTACHTTPPTGLVKPTSDLCNDCHSMKTASSQKIHDKHVEKYACSKCHKF